MIHRWRWFSVPCLLLSDTTLRVQKKEKVQTGNYLHLCVLTNKLNVNTMFFYYRFGASDNFQELGMAKVNQFFIRKLYFPLKLKI